MRRKRTRTIGRGREYYDYLASDGWKDVKARYLASGLPKICFVCLVPWNPSFNFHHKTYKRLGVELLEDLLPVCRRCHLAIHDLERTERLSLKAASRRQRVRKYLGLPNFRCDWKGVPRDRAEREVFIDVRDSIR